MQKNKVLEMFRVQTFRVETEGVFLNARVLSVQEQRGGSSSHYYYSATDILIFRFNLSKHFIWRSFFTSFFQTWKRFCTIMNDRSSLCAEKKSAYRL